MNLKKLLIALFTLCLSFQAFGESLQGVIGKDDQNDISIKIKGQLYSIEKNSPIRSTLEKLNSGDFISAQGVILSESSSVAIKSIDFVGLQKLLGTWYSGKQIFSFISYFDLELYNPPSTNQESSSHFLKYSMAPSQGNEWSLFFVNNDHITLGSLKFIEDHLEITLLNQDTGEVSNQLKLSRLSSTQPPYDQP